MALNTRPEHDGWKKGDNVCFARRTSSTSLNSEELQQVKLHNMLAASSHFHSESYIETFLPISQVATRQSPPSRDTSLTRHPPWSAVTTPQDRHTTLTQTSHHTSLHPPVVVHHCCHTTLMHYTGDQKGQPHQPPHSEVWPWKYNHKTHSTLSSAPAHTFPSCW